MRQKTSTQEQELPNLADAPWVLLHDPDDPEPEVFPDDGSHDADGALVVDPLGDMLDGFGSLLDDGRSHKEAQDMAWVCVPGPCNAQGKPDGWLKIVDGFLRRFGTGSIFGGLIRRLAQRPRDPGRGRGAGRCCRTRRL